MPKGEAIQERATVGVGHIENRVGIVGAVGKVTDVAAQYRGVCRDIALGRAILRAGKTAIEFDPAFQYKRTVPVGGRIWSVHAFGYPDLIACLSDGKRLV